MSKSVLLNYYKNVKSSYKVKLFYENLQYILKIYKNKDLIKIHVYDNYKIAIYNYFKIITSNKINKIEVKKEVKKRVYKIPSYRAWAYYYAYIENNSKFKGLEPLYINDFTRGRLYQLVNSVKNYLKKDDIKIIEKNEVLKKYDIKENKYIF